MTEKFNLDDKFSRFADPWRPKVIAALNGQEIKIVKVKPWKGQFRVEFRDCIVDLGPGEGIVEHRIVADDNAEIIVFEPAATRNTGNIIDDAFTAPNGVAV